MSDKTTSPDTEGYYWVARHDFDVFIEPGMNPRGLSIDSFEGDRRMVDSDETIRVTKHRYPDVLSAILAEPAVFGYDVGSMLELVAAGTAEMDCR